MKKYRYKTKRYKTGRYYQIKRRKRRGFRFFCLVFFGLIIFISLFYFLFFSSYFQIKEIKVTGNIKLPIEDIKDVISSQIDKKLIFFSLKNIFLANLEKINKEILERFPQIDTVNLHRDFPNVLAAQIKEREPIAVFCQSDDCYFIDRKGVAFEKKSEAFPETLKIKNEESILNNFKLGEKVIKEEFLSKILKIASRLKVPIKEVLIISERRLNVKTVEGWEIYFNPERDLDWQLTKLDIILKEKIPPPKREKIKYIDLRFERIYIYPETYRE